MRSVMRLIGLAAALGATAAGAQGFDPRAHRVFAGPSSEVLVLGTPHLSGLPKTFEPEHLAPVIDKLAAWKPQIITIESVSGPQCEELKRYAALHPDAWDSYCLDPSPAQKALGLDMPAALAEIEKTLANWTDPTPAQRRHLAALFLAGGEPASALTQWLRLPAAERHAGDGLDQGLVDFLDVRKTKRNEDYLLAAVLAARLGLDRDYPTDDHTSDDDTGNDEAYGKAVQAAWNNPASAARKKADDALQAKLGTPAGTLALYRAYNTPAAAEAAFDGDFGAALRDPSPEHFGRKYAGWWETRNLRMVANIRAVLQKRPGARLLTIVGASHIGYYKAYLTMLHDVTVADTQAVLR